MSLSQLPLDVLPIITSRLRGADLVSAAGTCTALRNSIDADKLRYEVAVTKLFAIIKNMERTDLYDRFIGCSDNEPAIYKMPDVPPGLSTKIYLCEEVQFYLWADDTDISMALFYMTPPVTQDVFRVAADYFGRHIERHGFKLFGQDALPISGPLGKQEEPVPALVTYQWTSNAPKRIRFEIDEVCILISPIDVSIDCWESDVTHHTIDVVARAVMFLPAFRQFLAPCDNEFLRLNLPSMAKR